MDGKRDKRRTVYVKKTAHTHSCGILRVSRVFTSNSNKKKSPAYFFPLSSDYLSSIPIFTTITLSTYSTSPVLFLPRLLFALSPYTSPLPLPPPPLPPPTPPPSPPFLASKEKFLQRLCTIPSRVEVKCFAGEHDSKQPLTVNEISAESTLNAYRAGGADGRGVGGSNCSEQCREGERGNCVYVCVFLHM